jgi:hypothetical protein
MPWKSVISKRAKRLHDFGQLSVDEKARLAELWPSDS